MTPHIQHNGQLADPLNAYAKAMKEISSKKKKTDQDHEKLADIEWMGGLYLNGDGRVIVPSYVLEGALVEAAKKHRLGEYAKGGIFVDCEPLLDYHGPKDVKELQKLPNFRHRVGVKIQQSRIMRTRPLFEAWGLTFYVDYDPELLNFDQVGQIVKTLGSKVGLSDYRPKFGRFVMTECVEVDEDGKLLAA